MTTLPSIHPHGAQKQGVPAIIFQEPIKNDKSSGEGEQVRVKYINI
jgi:hypothetical protein